jgi:hypothetical protein
VFFNASLTGRTLLILLFLQFYIKTYFTSQRRDLCYKTMKCTGFKASCTAERTKLNYVYKISTGIVSRYMKFLKHEVWRLQIIQFIAIAYLLLASISLK